MQKKISMAPFLTFAVLKVLRLFFLAVWTRLVLSILLYAVITEQLSTLAMLPWLFCHCQTYWTLQGISRLTHVDILLH